MQLGSPGIGTRSHSCSDLGLSPSLFSSPARLLPPHVLQGVQEELSPGKLTARREEILSLGEINLIGSLFFFSKAYPVSDQKGWGCTYMPISSRVDFFSSLNMSRTSGFKKISWEVEYFKTVNIIGLLRTAISVGTKHWVPEDFMNHCKQISAMLQCDCFKEGCVTLQ